MPSSQQKRSTNNNTWMRELHESNLFFDQLVDMIPAKLYVAGNSGDGIDYNAKYHKGQDAESISAKRARNKAAKRRAKYNPIMSETTHETKERLEREAKEQDDSSEEEEDNMMMIQQHQQEEEEEEERKSKKQSTTTSSSRIEALRAKLQAKLAEKRGHRPINNDPTQPNTVSKRAARRAEKQRRKQEAIAKAKKRGHAKLEQQKKTYIATAASAATPKSDLATIDFGKLTGLNETMDAARNNKSLANLSKSKNLQKMLADAEAKRERLEQLKQSGRAEDKAKAESIQWGDVLKEAQGDRVKDDPAKLRKAMKRQVAKKEKSRKAWASRMDQTQQAMDAKQAIRKHNLEKRKQGGVVGANLSKKRIVEQKKKNAQADGGGGGDVKTSSRRRKKLCRPGFEGRFQGFLN